MLRLRTRLQFHNFFYVAESKPGMILLTGVFGLLWTVGELLQLDEKAAHYLCVQKIRSDNNIAEMK